MKPHNTDDFLDNDDDDDLMEESRPEWMKWYYKRWITATQLMDPEQKGWYMNLLMYAAVQGQPPGYLPDDEEELMHLAGVKDLDTDVLHENKRWARVRRKFIESTEFPGLIFNKMLVNTLREAARKSKFNRKAVKKRWDNHKPKKKLDTPVIQTNYKSDTDVIHSPLTLSLNSKDRLLEKEEATSSKVLSLDLEEPQEQRRKTSSIPERKSKVTTDDILHIYKFWRTELKLGTRQPTDERKKKIRARLENDCTIEELELAIKGCSVSAWHMGTDENSPRAYNDIAQDICRNRGTVEKFIAIYEHHQSRKDNNNVNSGSLQNRRGESRAERESRLNHQNASLFAEDTEQLQAASEVDY